MKVVIAYDGSESAKDAIRGLGRAGLPHDAEVLVVSVADVWPPLPRPSSEPDSERSGWNKSPIVMKAATLAAASRAEAQTLAAEGAALVTTAFPGWKVSQAAYAGSPYLALIQAAEGKADLIVVGSQGRSALGGLVMGSVSQKVMRHATCSVRVSRRNDRITSGSRGFAPVRIILGVDGSTHSALAIKAVASRAWPAETEVKIVAVMDAKFWAVLADPGSSPWAWVGDAEEDGRTWADRAVAAVSEQLQSAGLIATSHVEEGDPKRVLVDVAERWKADCIFVGAKGHSGLERFLLGSVSAGVAMRAPCSVEVARQAAS